MQTWLDERIAGTTLKNLIREKTVPLHRHTVWYYFGGMTLFLFAVQVVTGILLLLYYRPTAESAFESVQFIMAEVHFGWLIRSLHSWSANLMILTLFIHMASVYLTRAYAKPREITWISGVGLLVLALGFGFSGYLLPWNKLAFFATQVGTQIVASVPVAGSFMLRFLRGGEEVTGATLTRFYGFHVAILPALTTALLAVHLLLVQLHGMSKPHSLPEGEKAGTMPFFPNFLLRDAVGWLVALGVLAALAAFFPWELGEKADPFAPAPQGIRPEWFFMWMFQTLKIVPAHIWVFEGEQVAVAGFGALLLVIAIVPLLDTTSRRQTLGRIFTLLGWLLLLYVLVMTFSGYLETPVFAASLLPAGPPTPQGVQLSENDIHRQRGLSCANCHAGEPAALKKSEVGMVCAKCHSDLNYMRQFNPQMRVDQWTEYMTSTHGKRNAAGDAKVATCSSCHSAHDVRSARDPRSPVHPHEVASTCGTCHEDQFAKYKGSEHAAALMVRRDLAAPACNDCHGNHGALPPGVDSVTAVCGQCHRQENDLFGKSPHSKPFQDLGLAGCIVCHDNHEIKKTDDRMVSIQGDTPCATCHADGEAVPKIQTMQSSILDLRLQIDVTFEVLGRAERAGMEVSKARFDLEQAHAQLIQSRVAVHAFNPDKITEFTKPGLEVTANAKSTADSAIEEIGVRRRGLLYSLIGIAILIGALLLKIRELEQR